MKIWIILNLEGDNQFLQVSSFDQRAKNFPAIAIEKTMKMLTRKQHIILPLKFFPHMDLVNFPPLSLIWTKWGVGLRKMQLIRKRNRVKGQDIVHITVQLDEEEWLRRIEIWACHRFLEGILLSYSKRKRSIMIMIKSWQATFL